MMMLLAVLAVLAKSEHRIDHHTDMIPALNFIPQMISAYTMYYHSYHSGSLVLLHTE